ncbi:MAG: preprotein translocase subunit SecG [Rikenellaceae bacterium]
MYLFCIILILIASALLVLSVLAQSPKSGMAANFGASNQVMGVRQTADFLERFTWILAIAILVLSLVATMVIPKGNIARSTTGVEKSLVQPYEGNQSLLPTATDVVEEAVETTEAAE